MEDVEMISAGKPIPRLAKVSPGQGRTVSVEWSDGRVSEIDLTPHLSHRAFVELVDDDVFRSVEADPWGWDIRWPSTKHAAIPTTILQSLEDGTYGKAHTAPDKQTDQG